MQIARVARGFSGAELGWLIPVRGLVSASERQLAGFSSQRGHSLMDAVLRTARDAKLSRI